MSFLDRQIVGEPDQFKTSFTINQHLARIIHKLEDFSL